MLLLPPPPSSFCEFEQCDHNDEQVVLHFFCFVFGDLRGESNRNPFFVQGGTSIMEGNETCIAMQKKKGVVIKDPDPLLT